jgi:hypothetical protein
MYGRFVQTMTIDKRGTAYTHVAALLDLMAHQAARQILSAG